jgi:cleavage and polyadenylation specificity factor subunit 1
MDRIFFDLPFVFVYLDDMLVASRSADEHKVHLRQVLQLLSDNGLVINADKCIWGQQQLEFLGHQVSAAGIAPLAARVTAIQQFQRPCNVQQLQGFLGLLNFYRKFIPAAAAVVRPLTDALRGGRSGKQRVQWTTAMDAAFKAAKAALQAATLLEHPDAAAEISLVSDASATHVGAVLQQKRLGQAWRPLGFFSRKLSPAEEKYSAFDRELLAVYASIQHFRYMLEGRRFVVFTDHKPLVGALDRVSEPKSDRQRRQLSAIAEFTAEIRHISGQSNVVADTLSRPPPATPCSYADAVRGQGAGSQPATAAPPSTSPPSPSTPSLVSAATLPAPVPPGEASQTPPLDIHEIAAAQPGCHDCQRARTSAALRVISVQMEGAAVLVDVSSGVMRPLVPAQLRRAVFSAVHSLAHPGVRATRRLIASRFLWPGLARDVAQWCKDCVQCQRAKVTKQHAAPMKPIPVPAARFSHVHVDLVGPLPEATGGFQYIFTAIDRSTRWAEVFPLRATTAADCARAFLSGWVARYGVPSCLTSDRGVQFCSSVWAALMTQLGVKHAMTSAYHPQSNGVLERFHRRMKEALKARAAAADWPEHLPAVMLGLRSAPREDSGISAAELVFGAPLQLPGQLLSAAEAQPATFMQQLRVGMPCVAPLPPPPPSTASASSPLLTADFVYIRSPPSSPALTPAYRGPYLVHKRSSKVFIVKIGERYEAVTLDRLKPHLGGPPQAAAPPRRGRPPGRPSPGSSSSPQASTGGG